MTATRLLASLLIALAGCAVHAATPASPSTATTQSPMRTDWITPATFADTPVGTTDEHPCLPATHGLDPQVNIAAPTRVTPRPDGVLVVPICMRGLVPVSAGMDPATVHARDIATGKEYSGVAYVRPLPGARHGFHVDPHPNYRPKLPPIPPGTRVSHQFTTDLVRNAGIPREPAVYEVHILAGGLKSETVQVEVAAPEQ
ncbi:hypothetical protein ANT2_0775 [plant metagenome]|uniref:Lipoprotein n=1 Tax=plant metagenome TaxID=1297885 RepID=A0A484PJT1_9ZZZZ